MKNSTICILIFLIVTLPCVSAEDALSRRLRHHLQSGNEDVDRALYKLCEVESELGIYTMSEQEEKDLLEMCALLRNKKHATSLTDRKLHFIDKMSIAMKKSRSEIKERISVVERRAPGIVAELVAQCRAIPKYRNLTFSQPTQELFSEMLKIDLILGLSGLTLALATANQELTTLIANKIENKFREDKRMHELLHKKPKKSPKASPKRQSR